MPSAFPSILGLGIDLVEINRIAQMLSDHNDRFLSRCFTPAEQNHQRDSRRYHEHLAARFAAKEAAMKALGTGLDHGLTWTDIEIISEPTGKPTLRLTNRAAAIANTLGIKAWHVSLSHTESHATAIVIAQG